jgi:hypothetical protein
MSGGVFASASHCCVVASVDVCKIAAAASTAQKHLLDHSAILGMPVVQRMKGIRRCGKNRRARSSMIYVQIGGVIQILIVRFSKD